MKSGCRICMDYAPTSPGKGRCLWHDISTTPGGRCYRAPRATRKDAFLVASAGVVQGELERTAWERGQRFTVPRPRYQLEPAPEWEH